MSGKTVFIIGPGFIGWNVLELLVAEGYQVTGLVRRKEHAAAIEKSGAKAILGDLHDKDLISSETAKSDVRIPNPYNRPRRNPLTLTTRSSSTPPPPTTSPRSSPCSRA